MAAPWNPPGFDQGPAGGAPVALQIAARLTDPYLAGLMDSDGCGSEWWGECQLNITQSNYRFLEVIDEVAFGGIGDITVCGQPPGNVANPGCESRGSPSCGLRYTGQALWEVAFRLRPWLQRRCACGSQWETRIGRLIGSVSVHFDFDLSFKVKGIPFTLKCHE